MKKYFTKISLLIIVCITGNSLNKHAHAWTAGQPVPDSTIIRCAYGILGGCYPNADVTFSFSMPAVTGITYYGVVSSADPNSAYINPGHDTLMLNDTIPIATGANFIELFYFSAVPATTPVWIDIKASGTPTVAGEAYPCNLNFIWLTNLLLCPDGLSKNVTATCTVANSTGIPVTPFDQLVISYPASDNNYTLEIRDASPVKVISVYDITGKKMMSASPLTKHSSLKCDVLANGLYFLSVLRIDGNRFTGKFNVARR